MQACHDVQIPGWYRPNDAQIFKNWAVYHSADNMACKVCVEYAYENKNTPLRDFPVLQSIYILRQS